MKGLSVYLSLMVLVFAGPSLSNEINITGVSKLEHKSFIEKAVFDLGTAFLDKIGFIEISFKDLGPFPDDVCATSGVKWGMIKKSNNKIIINRNLLKYIDEDKKIDCFHKSMKKQLLSTIYHEVAHMYSFVTRMERNREYLFLSYTKKLSSTKRLGRRRVKRVKYINANKNPSRSPDLYEYEKLSEHFAVNFEYFLLDETYSCRRPGLFRFFSRELSLFPQQKCQADRSIVIDGDVENKVILDPKNVRSISYLLAGEGEGIVSGFGHSMAKIELCKNEDCSAVQEVVAEFNAYSGDFGYSNWKGLTGAYPSKISFKSLNNKLHEYNLFQQREVFEYPIKLDDEGKLRFVEQMLKLLWEYNGDYYFLTNNCADELFKLFQYAVNASEFYEERIITPNGILEQLIDYELVDPSVALEFKSFKQVVGACEKYNIDVSKFLKLTPSKREEFFNDRASLDPICSYAMEKTAYYKDLYMFKKRYSAKLREEESREFKVLFEKIFEADRYLLYGVQPKEGYGIPHKNETKKNDDLLKHYSRIKSDSLNELYKKTGYFESVDQIKKDSKQVLRVIYQNYSKGREI